MPSDPDPIGDPILQQFRTVLQHDYGARIARIVLFGSRARGNAGADSDYDVARVLPALPDAPAARKHLADLRVDFRDRAGGFFDALAFPAHAWEDRTPLMHEIRRDGRML